MQLQNLGFVILSRDVRATSDFYVRAFGFRALVVLDWFASHQHPSFEGVFLDVLDADHETAGSHLRGQRTTGTMVALVVADAGAERDRLVGLGLQVVMDLRDEPWGQRRFQVLAPDDVVVEVVQRIEPDPTWSAG